MRGGDRHAANALIPALVFLLAATVVIALHRVTAQRDAAIATSESTVTAEQIAVRLEEYIDLRLALVRHLAVEWPEQSVSSTEEFSSQVSGLYETLGGLQAINWIDGDGVIRWVYPQDGNQQAQGRDLQTHAVAGPILRNSARTGLMEVTPPVDLYQGGRGFTSYTPVYVGNRILGYLNTVFRVQPMIEECLRRGVSEEFDFSVSDGASPIYSSSPRGQLESRAVVASASLQVGGRRWVVDLRPSPDSHAYPAPTVSRFSLLVGLFMAASLALLSWWLLHSRERERRSSEELRRIVETAREGVWTIDCEGRTTFLNLRMATMLGRRVEDVIGRPISDFMDDEAKLEAERNLERRRQGIHEGHEFRWLRPDGTVVWTWMSTSPLMDKDGNFIGALAMVSDITAERSERQLRRSTEEQLSVALEGADMGLWAWDQSSDQLTLRRIQSILGYSDEEFPPHISTIERFAHPLDYPNVVLAFEEQTSGKVNALDLEFRMRAHDGQWKWLQIRGQVVERTSDGAPLRSAGTFLDVTERHRAETERKKFTERMQQSQKLESMGVLAGGVAHDFNNILMTVLGNADLAEIALQGTAGPAGQAIQEIRIAAHRAAEVCQQMLAYSGRGRSSVEAIDLNQVVTEMRQLLEVTKSKNARIAAELDPALPVVDGDGTQMAQVVMNLILNASEALDGKVGTIDLRTGVRRHEGWSTEWTASGAELASGDYVYLEVVDSGVGMSDHVRKRIFEPFFTTKFAGRGLGMAAVEGIVRSHEGSIAVRSAPGHGTSITVLLPKGHLTCDSAASESSPVGRHTGTVLVVDDEPAILELMTKLLPMHGYEVATAGDGLLAIDAVRDDAHRFDVVLLDLTMPRMDGRETISHLRNLAPDLPILLSSGFDPQEVEAQFVQNPPDAYIKKPYESKDLLAQLDALIGASTEPGEPRCDVVVSALSP